MDPGRSSESAIARPNQNRNLGPRSRGRGYADRCPPRPGFFNPSAATARGEIGSILFIHRPPRRIVTVRFQEDLPVQLDQDIRLILQDPPVLLQKGQQVNPFPNLSGVHNHCDCPDGKVQAGKGLIYPLGKVLNLLET